MGSGRTKDFQKKVEIELGLLWELYYLLDNLASDSDFDRDQMLSDAHAEAYLILSSEGVDF